MKIIICDKLPRILKNKAKLEKTLSIKIANRGKEVKISGKAENEYTAEKVIDALNFGFPYSTALLIKEENATFEIINIKDHTTRKDLEIIRARLIGKRGKTLSTLSQLTKCNFELKDNYIGIIRNPEFIENAQESIIHIIKGSKQSNVYSFLEKHQVKEPDDFGLK